VFNERYDSLDISAEGERIWRVKVDNVYLSINHSEVLMFYEGRMKRFYFLAESEAQEFMNEIRRWLLKQPEAREVENDRA
jgi:hypothetical protein